MRDFKRLRTIDKTYEEIKKLDPDTAITRSMLRNAVNEGDIPFMRVNSRKLITLEDVEAYIDGSIKGMKEHQKAGHYLT